MLIELIAVVANTAIAARLLSYRRGSSRYRPGMSLLAYLLIVCSGGQAIDIVFNEAVTSVWEAGFALVFAALVWRARGNVACIVRVAHD